MSAVAPTPRRAVRPAPATPRLALLGTGTVGSAFVHRYQVLAGRGLRLPTFIWLANSRTALACGKAPDAALAQACRAERRDPAAPPRDPGLRGSSPGLQPWAETEALRAGDVLVDATASEGVANWHAEWLARGVHVVTANKLGRGAALARAQAIEESRALSGAGYGDSATVGAGLPLLSSVRALVAGGDHIHAVEGVLSGSLAWLFHHFEGQVPFSALVRRARERGYTEPDPRVDLSGEDVRRKLLILARSAGMPLEARRVQVQSLVPPALAALPAAAVDGQLETLDAALAPALQQARDDGLCLRFVARFDADGARVGLRALPAAHPLCGGAGTDNRVAIHSDRYREQPLLIQGPGAGAEVTAAALLDDVLRVVDP